MSADSDHSMGQPAPDRPIDWEPADLPAPEETADLDAREEPGWYADDAIAIGEPAWEAPDLHEPPDEGPPQGAPFADGGWADALAPDPVLATLVDLVQRDGLDKLNDDQLTGVLQAANRLAAWSASVRVAAVSGWLLAASSRARSRETGGRLTTWMTRSPSRSP